mgnify:CR=1 FL=1
MLNMEKNFCEFLDSYQYDHAEQFLFEIIRSTYLAGWNAALKSQRAANGSTPLDNISPAVSFQETEE